MKKILKIILKIILDIIIICLGVFMSFILFLGIISMKLENIEESIDPKRDGIFLKLFYYFSVYLHNLISVIEGPFTLLTAFGYGINPNSRVIEYFKSKDKEINLLAYNLLIENNYILKFIVFIDTKIPDSTDTDSKEEILSTFKEEDNYRTKFIDYNRFRSEIKEWKPESINFEGVMIPLITFMINLTLLKIKING